MGTSRPRTLWRGLRIRSGAPRRSSLSTPILFTLPVVLVAYYVSAVHSSNLLIPAAAALILFVEGLVLAPANLLALIFVLVPAFWALGYLQLLPVSGINVNLPIVVGGLVSVGFAPRALRASGDRRIKNIQLLVLGLGVTTLPAVFFAVNLATGLGVYIRILSPFLILFATLYLATDHQRIERLAHAMLLSLAVTGVVLVIELSQGKFFVSLQGINRISGLYIPPQQVAFYLTVMIAVVAATYASPRRVLYLPLLGFLAVAIYFTYIRTAWIGAVVMALLFASFLRRAWTLRLIVAIAIVAGVFNSGQLFAAFTRHSTDIRSFAGLDVITSGRLSIDRANLDFYLASPVANKVFGIGLYRSLQVTGQSSVGGQLLVHDDYLAMLVEAGFLSALIYIALISLLINEAYRNLKQQREGPGNGIAVASFVLILTVFIMGIGGAWYTNVMSGWYIFGFMGLMLAQRRLPSQSGTGIASGRWREAWIHEPRRLLAP